jgi:hypothetical protein
MKDERAAVLAQDRRLLGDERAADNISQFHGNPEISDFRIQISDWISDSGNLKSEL